MCPKSRLSYKWLKGLPIDGKQYYRDVQRCPKPTSAYNKRPYPTAPKQRPFMAESAAIRVQFKGKRPLHESRPTSYYRVEGNHPERMNEISSSYGIKARNWPPRPASHKIESDHLRRRPKLGPKQGVRAKQ